jgi:predicted negative regulator of RcsB-dependent stress response
MAQSEPKADSARPQVAALAAILAGLVFVGVSFLPTFQSGSERWTNDRAREYQDAALAIQNLSHHAATQTPDTASRADAEKLEQALAHFQNLQQELETARSQSAGLGVLLRVVGVLLAIGGSILYVAWRPTAPESIDHASNRFSSRTS